ncbi:hypothetical protein OG738_29260 [Amycolatopsis sp. NBC_01488]|uniref:hypothetical protein n=1 Tax=Amycolatopsis sp. NBC_01488 TaxID=2903563 RepID=UPI002E28A782|nr:hypothetical protein [Amycolatopsis sp. NBC_01488]
MGPQRRDQGSLRDMITVLSGLGTGLSATLATGYTKVMEIPPALTGPPLPSS